MNGHPKLRFVEAIPLDYEGEQRYALRDPSGLAEDIIVVSGEALFILQYFDGKHSLLEIRAEFLKALGTQLPESKLQELIAALDQAHLLESKSFQGYKRGLESQMLAQTVRPAVHAGTSYPSEPEPLRQRLESFYRTGAGLPALENRANGVASVRGLIAPHIDLRVGGACYTYAYHALADSTPADIYVILGTGHSGLSNCYSCLKQDFATPLGTVEHNAEFIAELARRHSHDLFSEPLPHRTEHTIEFQTVFLQHLFGGRKSFSIAPVLCSYAYPMLTDQRFAREHKIIDAFVAALHETCESFTSRGRRVCVIASVDFSHVGPRYGDEQALDTSFLQRVDQADHQLIQAITMVDAGQFVDTTARLLDRYRVCGFAPIHTLLSTTSAKTGKLLKYEQGLVDDKKSVVSYASLALY
jgi:AmmeMemoRadiSam system protein B